MSKRYTLYRVLATLGNVNKEDLAVAETFLQSAQVLETDTVFIPAGWDTRGKIAVMRDTFDATADFLLNEELESRYLAMLPGTLRHV